MGHGNDQIRIYARFACQLPSQLFAAGLHRPAEDDAIGPREVDVFEDATRLRRGRGVKTRTDAFGTDDDEFSRLHVAQVIGADEIEGASLGSEHDRVTLLAFD